MRRPCVSLLALLMSVIGLTVLGGAPAQAQVTVHGLDAEPNTFYPRVVDGYRDSTVLDLYFEGDADIKFEVISRQHGGTVRTVWKYNQWDGSTWRWNGTNNGGTKVSTGDYKVRATAYDDDGVHAGQASTRVTVATGVKTVRVNKVKYGYERTGQQRRGSCDITPGYWSEVGLFLDCWGGKHALARYRFAIPANAKNITWAARGSVYCCNNGKVTRTRTRPSATATVITVKVTGWRGFDVRRVELNYDTKKQI